MGSGRRTQIRGTSGTQISGTAPPYLLPSKAQYTIAFQDVRHIVSTALQPNLQIQQQCDEQLL